MSSDLTVNFAGVVAEQELLIFVAGVVDGAERHPTYVRREGLNVYVDRLDADQWEAEPVILNVRVRTVLVIQAKSLVSVDAAEAAKAAAVRLAVRCLDRFGDGLMLDNGETVVLLRRGSSTTRNSLWPAWAENAYLADVVAAFPEAELAPPELTG